MRFIDVSNWQTQIISTKGSRDKGVIFEPESGETYFIKFPMLRENRDYPTETWSEIIAYDIGTKLGFNVLRYDFAILNGRAGCISKNMVKDKYESLVEGDSILTAYDHTYDPNNKGTYNKYTFHFVMEALKNSHLECFAKDFIKILIFDSIIGNSDRHQSNWGFIQRVEIEHITTKNKNIFKRNSQAIHSKVKKTVNLAPIYDSGCCLGREYGEEQIEERLKDDNKFNSFIRKGYAELRGDDEPNKKKNHFDLLKYIGNQNNVWKDYIKTEITQIFNIYNYEDINLIIKNIDLELPYGIKKIFGLSDIRKEFIIKVINTRINELRNLI